MSLLEEVLKLSKSAKPLIKPMNYDDVIKEIKECATYGSYRHYFDIDKLSEETKEKLKIEGFKVNDLMQMSKTKISWKQKNPMKIYISGAITNNPNFKEDFEKAEDYLQREFPKAEIINPALVNSHLPKSTTHEEYMRMSFCMLDMADTIFMMSNYENSKGACMELGYALAKDKTILFERS